MSTSTVSMKAMTLFFYTIVALMVLLNLNSINALTITTKTFNTRSSSPRVIIRDHDHDHTSSSDLQEEAHQQPEEEDEHQKLGRRRADSAILNLSTTLQPFYSIHNTIYGGFSSKPLQLAAKAKSIATIDMIGSMDFYQNDIFNYINNGEVPHAAIYGFAATFDPLSSSNSPASSSGYTFFKSVANHNDNQNAKSVDSAKSLKTTRSIDHHSALFSKRQDDKVQCRNQKGESALFSKGDCMSAASKMASEKTALSTCGGCQLVLIGPQGQLSSSNIPAIDLQNHASNILSGCTTGIRLDSSNRILASPSTPIARNKRPSYVILITQGFGPSCN